MTWLINIYSIFITVIFCNVLNAQVYTVNTDDDIDNGVCTVLHCSLREAINAAEADGVASTIVFNIPGAGPHSIIPNGPFPTITHSDINIVGESQPGGPGSVLIDFNYKSFFGMGFWKILKPRFKISGINFTGFLFDTLGEHIIQLGDYGESASGSMVYNCSFISDSTATNNQADTIKKLIYVLNADSLIISNCQFGTDHSKKAISHLNGYIYIDVAQWKGKVKIDSNFFVNQRSGIHGFGGDLSVTNNIFGALDTFKLANGLLPQYGIWAINLEKGFIQNNYFYGVQSAAIRLESCFNPIVISKNRFYNCRDDIYINYNADNTIYILDNFARHGNYFLDVDRGSLNVDYYVERNDADDFLYFISILRHKTSDLKFFRHIDNKLTCIKNGPIYTLGLKPLPKIIRIDKDQIIGTGVRTDSIIVYYNPRIGCPDARCEGGYELGRTQADAGGAWKLNVAIPTHSAISAYQFDPDPTAVSNIYSEFACYYCVEPVRLNLTRSICPGDTLFYRDHAFSKSNPIDSFRIKSDFHDLCDSVFLVNLDIHNSYRSNLDVSICYDDTLQYGLIKINRNHLFDSVNFQSINGCDSTVILNATLVGTSKFDHTICENDSLRIGNSTFNKDHLSGQAVIKGVSSMGCDSIVEVNLSINNSFSVDLPNDTTVHKGSPITIKPFVNFIPSSIKWSPNLYLDCDTCLYPISKPENNITYQFTAKDPNGCDVSDQFTISVLIDNAEIFIPNAFSPNGDNINDIFQPVFKFPNSTTIKEFRIYDRWGVQVYQRFDGAIGEIFGWDGTSNGEKMNPGVYIYWIQFAGEDSVIKVKAGDVILVR